MSRLVKDAIMSCGVNLNPCVRIRVVNTGIQPLTIKKFTAELIAKPVPYIIIGVTLLTYAVVALLKKQQDILCVSVIMKVKVIIKARVYRSIW